MRTCVVVIVCAVLIGGQFVLPASSAVGSYDEQGLGDEAVGEYSENYYDRFVPTNQKRSCVRRGGSCDHRPKDCCHNSSCRCNLWGANCRCQRMGLFQKWG